MRNPKSILKIQLLPQSYYKANDNLFNEAKKKVTGVLMIKNYILGGQWHYTHLVLALWRHRKVDFCVPSSIWSVE